MTPATRPFRLGLSDSLPFLLVLGPFALLFGVASVEAGLDVVEAVSFSIIVIAGAAQFTALQMLGDQVPTLIVMATALAVNLRMAMYSASLTPWLGAAPLWQRAIAAYVLFDSTYACAITRFEAHPRWSIDQRFAYLIGSVVVVVPMWFALTLAGALIGRGIPGWLALDFAVPICFLAMIAPALRTAPQVLAAGVSILGALLLSGLPYGLGLLVAAILAMATGAEAERRLALRQAEA